MAKIDEGEPLPPVPTYIFDIEMLNGREPEVFCRQPEEDNRREHSGGTPGIGFEGTDDCRQPVPVIEFDYGSISGECDDEQHAYCVTTVEMLIWLQEPLITSRCAPTDNLFKYKYHILLLILCPHALGAPTLAELATRLGTTKQTLGKIVADFKLRYPEVQTSWMKSTNSRADQTEILEGDSRMLYEN